MRYFLILLVFFISFGVSAADEVPIRLEKVNVDTSDLASVKRGAKYFATTCMVCHTMKYLQHDKIAHAAGITLDKMPLKKKDWWLNIVPPDMTLLAKRRSPEWIYTYLHSFYKDESRPTGYNNLLAKDINMPNQFVGLQGVQVLTSRGEKILADSKWRKPHYYSVLEMVKSGSMTPDEFNNLTQDLVNFFVYAANPKTNFRLHLGIWVLLFLVILLILAFLLKRAYWRK